MFFHQLENEFCGLYCLTDFFMDFDLIFWPDFLARFFGLQFRAGPNFSLKSRAGPMARRYTCQRARNSPRGENLCEENSSQGKGCFLRKEKFENLQV